MCVLGEHKHFNKSQHPKFPLKKIQNKSKKWFCFDGSGYILKDDHNYYIYKYNMYICTHI